MPNLDTPLECPTVATFLSTLVYSWGGDTPPEAIWALQDFVNWVNATKGLDLQAPTEDDYDDDIFDTKLQLIIDALDT